MESPLIVIDRGTKITGRVVGDLKSYTKVQVHWSDGKFETIDPARNQDKFLVCLEVSPESQAVLNPDEVINEFASNSEALFTRFLERRRLNNDFVSGEEFLLQFERAFEDVIDAGQIRSAWPATKKDWEKGKTVNLIKKSGRWHYRGKETWVPTFEEGALIETQQIINDGNGETTKTIIEKVEKQVLSPYADALKKFTEAPVVTVNHWHTLLAKRYGHEDLYEALTNDETANKDKPVLSLISLGVDQIQRPQTEVLPKEEVKLLESLMVDFGQQLYPDRTSALRNSPMVLAIATSVYSNFEIRGLGPSAIFVLTSTITGNRKSKSQISKLLFNAVQELKKKPAKLDTWAKVALVEALKNLEFGSIHGDRERLTLDALKLGLIDIKNDGLFVGLNLLTLLKVTNSEFLKELVSSAPNRIFEIVKSGIGMTVSPGLLSELLVAEQWFIDFIEEHGLFPLIQASVKSLSKVDSYHGKLLNDGTVDVLTAKLREIDAEEAKAQKMLSSKLSELEKLNEKVSAELQTASARLQASLERSAQQLKDQSLAVGANMAKAIAKNLAEVNSNGAQLSTSQLFGRLQAAAAGVGVSVLGTRGEQIPYDPNSQTFEGEEPSIGELVSVVSSGYSWLVSGETHVLTKTIVSKGNL
jgi:hypothetical protein